MWARFFSTCRACAQLFEVARYRASKLASGRNHISVDESPDGPVSLRSLSLDFLLLPSLHSSPSSLYPLVSAARSDDALKLKTLEMGHSRHLFLSLSFSPTPLCLSSSFSLLLSFHVRFSVGCLGEKDRGPKERASPSVGCHSSYSFGSHVRGGGPWPVGRTNAG